MSESDEFDNFYFIADYHALNSLSSRDEMEKYTRELACTWLACGLNPEKVVFYRQSQISEISELCWILMNVTPKGLMDRAHAYKGVVEANQLANKDADDGVNMGLYCYPVLMAADILAFNSKFVTVGSDQRQHVEMTRDIAKHFNKKYGNIFVIPQERLTEKREIILGLDGRKMSKSYSNVFPLFCDEKTLKKLIMSLKTDSSLPNEPKSTDCLIFSYIKLFGTPEKISELEKRFAEGISWAEAKAELFEIVNEFVRPMRDKYDYFMSHYDEVEKILKAGEERARKIAKSTLERVKKAVGIN